MKKVIKILGYIIGGIILLALLAYLFVFVKAKLASGSNMKLLGEEAPTLLAEGFEYRDLNKNGSLDVYEDSRINIDDRVEDLLKQMNIEEKSGLLFITMASMGKNGKLGESNAFSFFLPSNSSIVAKRKMNHCNVLEASSAKALAIWTNNMQKMAERTRLGIPMTIATDPRHGAVYNLGASVPTPFYSAWPSPLGLAAIGDSALVHEFGDIARQEYIATGIRLALHPMADLATEPRWGRINGTFGEDAELSAKLSKAYVLGFQGDSLSSTSVACMSKHFSGGGPQKGGEDAHFPYGKDQVYPGNNFDYHLIPFTEGVLAANTAQIMPYYGVPVGQTSEDVGFGYNKDIIQTLLRDSLGFEGVVCTDWGLVSGNFAKPASAFGVEELTEVQRVKKIFDAGCDMLGGEANPEWVVELIESGELSEDRLNESVRRVLKDKFRLGLFDNPYVDADNLSIVGNDDFKAKGKEAQRKSLVLLKNDNKILPLAKNAKIYVEGFDKKMAASYGEVVSNPENADFIILKIATPFEPRSQYFIERFFHQGSLAFSEKEEAKLLELINKKPTITIVTMDRPPVIPAINDASKAMIADFNTELSTILELVFGEFKPSGKMPIEIPSSMDAVEKQMEDLPYDSENPLYPFGHGMSF